MVADSHLVFVIETVFAKTPSAGADFHGTAGARVSSCSSRPHPQHIRNMYMNTKEGKTENTSSKYAAQVLFYHTPAYTEHQAQVDSCRTLSSMFHSKEKKKEKEGRELQKYR